VLRLNVDVDERLMSTNDVRCYATGHDRWMWPWAGPSVSRLHPLPMQPVSSA